MNVLASSGDFPVYSIISQMQPNGHTLFLVFTDLDRSYAPTSGDVIPTDYGQVEHYDSVGFSIIDSRGPDVPTPGFPGSASANPVDGTVTSIGIPEPASPLLVGCALALGFGRRTRNQEVEQVAGGQAR